MFNLTDKGIDKIWVTWYNRELYQQITKDKLFQISAKINWPWD